MNTIEKSGCFEFLAIYEELAEVTLSRTIGRRDAAAELTGMYLQRVLESVTSGCDCSDTAMFI